MNMLMRVEVRGITADECSKRVQLCIDLCSHCVGIFDRDSFVARLPAGVSVLPLPKVQVEPDAESRPATTRGGCLPSIRPTDHEARARDDAALACLGDAAINSSAQTEIVGIHDEVSRRGHRAITDAGCLMRLRQFRR